MFGSENIETDKYLGFCVVAVAVCCGVVVASSEIVVKGVIDHILTSFYLEKKLTLLMQFSSLFGVCEGPRRRIVINY